MAMKKAKKSAPKARGGASYDMLVDVYGSDRGAKMKADNAQKKSQSKASAKSSGSPLNMTNAEQKAYGYKKSNDLAGTYANSGLGFRGGFVGRTSQRFIDQSKRADKKAAEKKAATKRKNYASSASKAKVAKGKK
jgi:hypothetical protein